MKNLIFSALVMVVSMSAQAKVVSSSQENISPASIDKMIRLVDKDEPGSSHEKLSIIVTDGGMSTDVSPRYTVYLGYASMAEMGNLAVDFKITDQAFQFKSAKRKAASIYEVKTVEYRDDGLYEVTQTIDATKMFIDEKNVRNKCGGDFCDGELNTTVIVKETAKKMNF